VLLATVALLSAEVAWTECMSRACADRRSDHRTEPLRGAPTLEREVGDL